MLQSRGWLCSGTQPTNSVGVAKLRFATGSPEKDFNDCLHIAYAAVNGCDTILSWNFRHMVNNVTRGKVRTVNAISRYNEIGIVSPDDFLMGGR
jgi:hypothetical protein